MHILYVQGRYFDLALMFPKVRSDHPRASGLYVFEKKLPFAGRPLIRRRSYDKHVNLDLIIHFLVQHKLPSRTFKLYCMCYHLVSLSAIQLSSA